MRRSIKPSERSETSKEGCEIHEQHAIAFSINPTGTADSRPLSLLVLCMGTGCCTKLETNATSVLFSIFLNGCAELESMPSRLSSDLVSVEDLLIMSDKSESKHVSTFKSPPLGTGSFLAVFFFCRGSPFTHIGFCGFVSCAGTAARGRKVICWCNGRSHSEGLECAPCPRTFCTPLACKPPSSSESRP
uniref:Uncharacterized protein TCIL3000_11_4580 n=1 Tax=Trypanosoma congolense (strain IL3000) TaxID=1068625 RepID=G0V083_TRYCI|nr:unnamed protein product [Trypanosoma congolense IL3000]